MEEKSMLRSALKIVLAAFLTCTVFSGVAVANDIHISGIVAFSSLDGSSDDHDGVANGVFTVNDGNLVIDGTVQCNDGPPLPGNAGACPIRISVSGDLVLEAGGAIVAENRTGGGGGANINLEVGGDLTLRGPAGASPGAVVSSGTRTGSGAAGSISASVDGAADLAAGSTLSASAAGGSAGAVGIKAGGGIRIAGLVASGPGTSLLASRWSGAVLGGGSNNQTGGTILLRSTSADEPGIRIEATGTVVSQGQSAGPQFVLLEACGIEVHGLVAAVSKNDSPARVALRSGKGILVDGRDLPGGSSSHLGRVRADSIEAGAATHLVDLFAEADIQIFGPMPGTTDLFAVSANPGTQTQRTGGSISSVSTAGALTASGNAFDAGRALSGNKGGKIDLRSAGDVDLADAHLRAVGGYLAASGSRRGGQISVRSYSGEIHWTFGTGDVRPTGSGTTAASRGTIKLTACSGIDTTGTTFPVLGSPVAPFPVEADGVCSPAAPSLPSGELPLPVCNVPPTAVNDVATVIEDSSNNAIDVLANDTDTDGGPKSVASVTQPANGAVSITGGGTGVSYTPNSNYCNNPPGTTPDTFTYTLNGGSMATVTVTVTCANDDPTAVNDAATVTEDSSNNAINVLANDTDVDGGTKSVDSVTQPANGAVSITGGGAGVSYTPSANYCNNPPGTTLDTFTYTLNGGSTATVSVTVTCADDDPTAVSDAATVTEDSSNNAIDVLVNDTNVDGGPKSVASVTQPANGAVSITGGGTGVSYTPNANYCNSISGTPDMFTYTLSPGGSTATVSVTVNCVDDPPTAVIDTATVSEDSGANMINVQANDADVDGGTNTISGVTQPANGTVVITNGGLNLTYAPNANYCNSVSGTPDTFSYTLTPGGSTATVSVTVTCVNDGPAVDLDADNDKGTAGSGFATTFTEGDPATLIEDPVDSTVTDIDSATLASLTVTITNLLDTGNETLSADVTGTSITANYVTDAMTGVLTLTGPDTLANFETVLRKVRYLNSDTSPDTTPRLIHFVANDGTADGNTAVSTVTIVGVDTSPTAVNDATTVNEDSGANVIDVLANDTDPDGGPISVASVTQPANGAVMITGGGTGLTYQPDANYCGADTFTYTLTPGGSSATVSVTVTCVDDNPMAVNDTATVTEDASATSIDVLANDTDADGGAKSITSATQPGNGTVAITGGGTGLTYQPNPNYCNSASGTPDTFTYTLTPGGSIATVSVTVTCVDDNPTAINDAATVVEDSSNNAIDVLANDPDPDGGTKSVASVVSPSSQGGTVAVTGGGTGVSFTPSANFCGADSFTYTLNPGGSIATVSVTVTCVDDPPEAVNDAATVLEDSGANAIDVLANDTDIDAGAKSVQSVTQPANGSVAITGGGSGVSYTPALNFCGSNSFTYTLNGGSIATVSVTVTCVNDAPVLGDSTIDYTILGNTQLRVGETTTGNSVLHIRDNNDVDEKSSPADVDGPGPLTVVPFSGSSTNGGNVVLNADGTFTYESAAGFTGTDTFPFTVTDNGAPAATTSGTVSITVSETVWYVHDVTGVDNPAASDTGRSTNAFEELEDVAAVLTDNDYIFVFRGNTSTTPHGGIRINKTGVKLHGEGVGLTVPGFGALIPAGSQPVIDNAADVPAQEDHGVAVDATLASLSGVEIRGLRIEGRDNGIEVTATGANNAGVTISNNTVSSDASTGLEGIDVNANGTGTVTVTASNNSLSGRGNAFDARTGAVGAKLQINLSNNTNILSTIGSGVVIDGTGGTMTVTGFSGNSVHSNTAGNGISVSNATFDQTPGGLVEQVAGGNTLIGASGSGVGAAGMVLTDVQGSLGFSDLDIFADGGAGLRVSGTGSGLTFSLSPDTGNVEATGGPAVDITSVTLTLPLSSLKSTNSPSTGVALNSVLGSFSAGAGSSISNITSVSGTAFRVGNSNATISYAGTINTTTGRGVDLTSNTGSTISFAGTLALSTGSNTAFNATGGGTVTATDTASTLTTTTGTALNVANTMIGASGLKFRTISSNGAVTGIVLNSTGSAGGLTVSGNGGTCTVATPTCTGGTIQSSTGAGISLSSTSNVNLSLMRVTGSGEDGILGSGVTGFSLSNSLVTNNGNALGENGFDFSNLFGTASITSSTISGSHNNNATIRNSSGTLTMLTVTGSMFSSNTSTSDGDGLLFEASGTANMSINVSGSTFSAHHSDHFQASALNSGVLNVVFSGNTLSGGHAAPLGQGITINAATGAPGFAGSVTYDVNGNTINGAISNAVMANLGTSSAAASFKGQIRNNVIGTSGSALSCSTQANGINVEAHGNGTHTVSVTGNTIRRCFDRGINVLANDGSGVFNLTATNNTVTEMSDINGVMGTPREAFLLQAGSTSTNVFGQVDNHAVCLSLSGPSGSLIGGAFKNGDIRTRQRFRSSVRMPGYAGSPFDTAAVIGFLQGNNPGSAATATTSDDATVTTDGYFGGAACPLP
jgi:VCBS repeat-containing protein